MGARILWRTNGGDWIDSAGTYRGMNCARPVTVTDTDTVKEVSFNIIDIASAWSGKPSANQGIVLLRNSSSGAIVFGSKEGGTPPRLDMTFSDGTSWSGTVAIDNMLAASLMSEGTRTTMESSGNVRPLVWFNIPDEVLAKTPTSATLRLTSTQQYGDSSICAFRVGGTVPDSVPVSTGIAASHPRDEGIASNPAVYFATDFSNDLWRQRMWMSGSEGTPPSVVANTETQSTGFVPLAGATHYLKSVINAGSYLGLWHEYRFTDAVNGGREVDEAYLRYYLLLGSSFASDFAIDGGKLPGLSGNSTICGNGGRAADGLCGWSARMNFEPPPRVGNPIRDQVGIGNYVYWANMPTTFGDHFFITDYAVGSIKVARWHCIEQRVKVNTPGVADGVIENWVDGVKGFSRTDMLFRKNPPYEIAGSNLGIQKAWFNFYHGGTSAAPTTLNFYITKVVVSRDRVGCYSN